MGAGPGTNVDFLDCVREMGEAVERFLSEGGSYSLTDDVIPG